MANTSLFIDGTIGGTSSRIQPRTTSPTIISEPATTQTAPAATIDPSTQLLENALNLGAVAFGGGGAGPTQAQTTLPSTLKALDVQEQQARLGTNINVRDLGQAIEQIQLQIQNTLRDIGIQRQTAQRARTTGLRDIGRAGDRARFEQQVGERDIGTALEQGIEGVQSQALRRGIFTSGIRERDQGRVETRAAEAKGDLTQRTKFTLDELGGRKEDLLSSVENALTALNNAQKDAEAGKDVNERDLREQIQDAQDQLALALQGLDLRRESAQAAAQAGGGGGGGATIDLGGLVAQLVGQVGLLEDRDEIAPVEPPSFNVPQTTAQSSFLAPRSFGFQ